MRQGRIILIVLSMIVAFAAFIHFFTSIVAPPETGQTFLAFDLSRPRVPSEARKLVNPIPISEEIIQQGDELFHGKGNCFVCHGDTGKGDGDAGVLLLPKPADLTNPSLHMLRTDGEIFWAMRYGIEASGMFALVPRMISEEEAWIIVHYVRTLKIERPLVD